MFEILVVEDNPEISRVIIKYLERENYFCTLAEDGFEALEKFADNKYHLVILDIMLPGIDGFEILSNIRDTSDIPVIMLTARQSEIDRIKGFAKGADDYVIKPFSPRELVSRVKVFLKRVYKENDEAFVSSGNLKLFTSSFRLEKDNQKIELTTAEFKIITALFRNKNQYLSREQLIEQAFGLDYEGNDRSIDSIIKRIRQKIEDNPGKPEYIKSKYGYGYMLGGKEE